MQMDLYLKRETAWNAVIWILNVTGVILLLWVTSVEANTAHIGSDYLFADDAKGGYLSLPHSTKSAGSPALTSAIKK